MILIKDPRRSLVVWVWAALLLGVCVRPLLQPGRSDLTLLWTQTGRLWWNSATPYHTGNDFESFRYSPLLAAACVPLAALPPWMATISWRLLSAAVLLFGLRAWLIHATPDQFSRRQTEWLLLLLAPLSLGCLNNGQANAILAGLLLLSLAAVAAAHWNQAACWLALATWLKVYPLALALILFTLYPRKLPLRYLLALLFLGLVPFALQSPGYVAEQYTIWFDLLDDNESHRRFLPFDKAYRDLLLLLRVWQIAPSVVGYTLLQLLGGMAAAGLCWWAKWHNVAERHLLLLVAVASLGWMMLLGPATESNTYMLFAPLACWLTVWMHRRGPTASRYLAGQAMGLLLLCVVSVAVPAGRTLYHAAGLQPLAVLLLLLAYGLTWTDSESKRRLQLVALMRQARLKPLAPPMLQLSLPAEKST